MSINFGSHPKIVDTRRVSQASGPGTGVAVSSQDWAIRSQLEGLDRRSSAGLGAEKCSSRHFSAPPSTSATSPVDLRRHNAERTIDRSPETETINTNKAGMRCMQDPEGEMPVRRLFRPLGTQPSSLPEMFASHSWLYFLSTSEVSGSSKIQTQCQACLSTSS